MGALSEKIAFGGGRVTTENEYPLFSPRYDIDEQFEYIFLLKTELYHLSTVQHPRLFPTGYFLQSIPPSAPHQRPPAASQHTVFPPV